MITKQIYLWTITPDATGSNLPQPGDQFSIFTGGYGDNITETALVREDFFVVIDDFGSTPGVCSNIITEGRFGIDPINITNYRPNGFVQIVVDTTHYYQNPENIKSWGISGDASPYPKDLTSNYGYLLEPNVYVPPFQTWDVRYVMLNDYNARAAGVGFNMDKPMAEVFVQYWLFSGSDALICNQLMKLGIEITVDNVEWFRRQLLRSRGLDTSTWDWYLRVSTEYWKEQREAQKLAPDLGLTLNNKKTKDKV